MKDNRSVYVNARFLTQNISGVQRFAIEISKQLKRCDLKIVFLAPKNILDDNLALELNVVKFGLSKGHIWEQVELPIYLARVGFPLLLNLTNTGPVVYKNHIATVHDLGFYLFPEWFSRRISLWYKFIIPAFARRAHSVLTVSQFSKAQIMQHFNIRHDKIYVVPNGVNKMLRSSSSKNYNNSMFTGSYILAVGSLDPRKNLISLIKAFELLPYPNLKLILIGDRKRVFKNSKYLDSLLSIKRVIFSGYLPDEQLEFAYHNAIAFVYPSVYEGFGIPPLEAMSFNCPVCVSDIEVLHETCGEAALYFDPKSVSSICHTLNLLLTDELLRKRLSREGKKRILKYKWEESGEIVCDLLNSSKY